MAADVRRFTMAVTARRTARTRSRRSTRVHATAGSRRAASRTTGAAGGARDTGPFDRSCRPDRSRAWPRVVTRSPVAGAMRGNAQPRWRLLVEASVRIARSGGEQRRGGATCSSARASSRCSAPAWRCWCCPTRRAQEARAAADGVRRRGLARAADAARGDPVRGRQPRRRRGRTTPAQIRKYGELVRSEGRRLTEMVEQILEFAGHPVGPARASSRGRSTSSAAARRRARVVGRADRGRRASRSRSTIPQDLPPVARRRAGAAPRVPEPGRQRHQVRRRRPLDRRSARDARPATRCRISVADRGIGIAAAEQSADLRAVLSRRRRGRGADPGRRPRPQPGPADRRGPRRPRSW